MKRHAPTTVEAVARTADAAQQHVDERSAELMRDSALATARRQLTGELRVPIQFA